MHVDLHVNHEVSVCCPKIKCIIAFELNKGLPVEILGIFFSSFEVVYELPS